MKKRLLTVGDSFTYGDELKNPKESAWPVLVAKAFNWDLLNLGSPGRGNTLIVRHIVENIEKFDAVIIAWTHFDRIEVADQYETFDIWPGRINVPNKHEYPWRTTINDYYTKYHNDDYLYRQYLLNIVLVQTYLDAHKKAYLMFDAFGNHQDNRRHNKNNKDLLNQINTKYFLGWPNEAMVEWIGDSPKGPRGHPLEVGHKRTADHINEYIRNIGWIS